MSKGVPVEILKKTIAYFYLLSFCPAERIVDYKKTASALRRNLAKGAGMKQADFFKAVIPEVCQRIVAFHEGTREPSQEWVDALVKTAAQADKSHKKAAAFQEQMSKVARLKARALPENRLHRKKGCDFCRLPCYYGYFTLVSEPDFNYLQHLLDLEAKRPQGEQNPLRPAWAFTISHLANTLEAEEGVIHRAHLGNLVYCLLLLSMAKSRLALPEVQLQTFQANNQALITAGQG